MFVDTDTAVREYPELVKESTSAPSCLLPEDNKFGALNTAAWSAAGSVSLYVPKGVHVDIPLQAYFRINTPAMGQLERALHHRGGRRLLRALRGRLHRPRSGPRTTLARRHRRDHRRKARPRALHHRAEEAGRTTSTTSSPSVPTCARASTMESVDGNIGSRATMKYRACILAEPSRRHPPCPSASPARASTRTRARR